MNLGVGRATRVAPSSRLQSGATRYVCEIGGWCVFNSYWTLEGALAQKIHRSSHRSSELFFHRDMDK